MKIKNVTVFLGKLLAPLTFTMSFTAFAEAPTWTDPETHIEWAFLGADNLTLARRACSSLEGVGSSWQPLSDANMKNVALSLRRLAFASPLAANVFEGSDLHATANGGKKWFPTRVFWIASQDSARQRAIKYYEEREMLVREISDLDSSFSPRVADPARDRLKVVEQQIANLEGGKIAPTIRVHNDEVLFHAPEPVVAHWGDEDIEPASYLANVVCFRIAR